MRVLGQKSKNVLSSSNTVQRLFSVIPPMALLNSSSELCKKHSQIYLSELEKLTTWALKSKYNFYLNIILLIN